VRKSFVVAWLALAALPAIAQAPLLIVKDAWVRTTPGADVMAVYLNLRNASPQPIIVIGVQSPVASHSMMHETSLVKGQSRMRMREHVVIAPGQTLSFAPGGQHIMLSGLKRPVAVGQSVPLVLLLADGGKVSVVALVKPLVTP
jgi:copper(I)-binding protein